MWPLQVNNASIVIATIVKKDSLKKSENNFVLFYGADHLFIVQNILHLLCQNMMNALDIYIFIIHLEI